MISVEEKAARKLATKEKRMKYQRDYVRNRRRTDAAYRTRGYGLVKRWLQSAKEGCVNVYSNGDAACKWCGMADMDVLCLDHIDDNGKQKPFGHRGGQFLYARLRQLQYPEGFQVLCCNCNMKKEMMRRRNSRKVAR